MTNKPFDPSKLEVILDDCSGPHLAQRLRVSHSADSEVLTDEIIYALIETGVSNGRGEVILDQYGYRPIKPTKGR